MGDVIVAMPGVELPMHRCSDCLGGMRIALAPKPLYALRCAKCVPFVRLFFCVPTDQSLPLEAFWNSECPKGMDVLVFARERLGARASKYGFPVAVPG